MFVPKHNRMKKTVKFVRLMNGFNVGSWIKELVNTVKISIDMSIHVGFSFIAVKQLPNISYKYFYAAKDLCLINGNFDNEKDALKFAENLEKQDYADFHEETFFATESGDPFQKSGFGPKQLIGCYVWITK